MKKVSILVPVFNEEESIPLYLERMLPLVQKEAYRFEFVFIDDGSSDQTLEILLETREKAAGSVDIRIIELSRNFGKENAMLAGFQAVDGDAVIPMDVDLQDPPELIPQFLRKWEEGHDMVVGVRRQRNADTWFKRWTARQFYRVFNALCGRRLVPQAGDYRLMSRDVIDALNSLPEHTRFTKGLYAWVGFKKAVVTFERAPRAAGRSKWNAWKLWNFALDGITGFSTLPLRIWSYLGIVVAMFGFGYGLFLVVRTLVFGVEVPGYTSIMVTILILGGMILTSLGVIGEYLGRIFEESKRRPSYIIRRRIGFETEKKPS